MTIRASRVVLTMLPATALSLPTPRICRTRGKRCLRSWKPLWATCVTVVTVRVLAKLLGLRAPLRDC